MGSFVTKTYAVLSNYAGELGEYELTSENRLKVAKDLFETIEVGDVIKIEERLTEI